MGQLEVLQAIEKNGGRATFDDVKEEVDCHKRQIYGALNKLEKNGEIEKTKEPNFPLQPKAEWEVKE